jgi:putative oxidoreductase
MAKEFIRSHLPQIARIILGVIFCISGINYVFGIFHVQYSVAGQSFIENLQAIGVVWPLLKITELICGLMLVFGYFGPLALFILAPITLGIVFFHAFLSPGQGSLLGYIVFALEVGLIIYWRKYFIHLFRDFFADIDNDRIAD